MTSATSRAAMWLPVPDRLTPLRSAAATSSRADHEAWGRPRLLEFEAKVQPTDSDQREEVE
jgi:hypothetical protein